MYIHCTLIFGAREVGLPYYWLKVNIWETQRLIPHINYLLSYLNLNIPVSQNTVSVGIWGREM